MVYIELNRCLMNIRLGSITRLSTQQFLQQEEMKFCQRTAPIHCKSYSISSYEQCSVWLLGDRAPHQQIKVQLYTTLAPEIYQVILTNHSLPPSLKDICQADLTRLYEIIGKDVIFKNGDGDRREMLCEIRLTVFEGQPKVTRFYIASEVFYKKERQPLKEEVNTMMNQIAQQLRHRLQSELRGLKTRTGELQKGLGRQASNLDILTSMHQQIKQLHQKFTTKSIGNPSVVAASQGQSSQVEGRGKASTLVIQQQLPMVLNKDLSERNIIIPLQGHQKWYKNNERVCFEYCNSDTIKRRYSSALLRAAQTPSATHFQLKWQMQFNQHHQNQKLYEFSLGLVHSAELPVLLKLEGMNQYKQSQVQKCLFGVQVNGEDIRYKNHGQFLLMEEAQSVRQVRSISMTIRMEVQTQKTIEIAVNINRHQKQTLNNSEELSRFKGSISEYVPYLFLFSRFLHFKPSYDI